MIYLACPYSHPDREVRIYRFNAVNRVAAHLMSNGEIVFSPISHTHPIAEAGELPLGWDYWERFDRTFLQMSQRFIILTLDEWQESKGVAAEIKIARELGLKVEYMHDELPRISL